VSDELPEEVQRWTAKRRSALIVSIIRGETSVQEASRRRGLTVAEVEDWREKFLLAAENALRTRPRDEETQKDEQIKKLKQKVGELVLDMDILKEECVWQHLFQDFGHARREIRDWIRWYNEERPHQSLGYRSPVEYRAQQLQLVA